LLSALRSVDSKNKAQTPILVASTMDALLGSCPILQDCEDSQIALTSGREIPYQQFCQDLIDKLDYSSEVVCEEPGQFAIRGGLIDIYPVNADFPVRLDFFGDTLEEIRKFDPTTQRTSESITEIKVSSINNEAFAERNGEIFNYLNFPVLWFFVEPENLLRIHPLAFHETGNHATEKANISMVWKRDAGDLDSFLSFSEIDAGAGIFDSSQKINLSVKPIIPDLDHYSSDSELDFSDRTQEINQRKSIHFAQECISAGFRLYVSIGAEAEKTRITELLNEKSLSSKNYTFLTVGLHRGFSFDRTGTGSAFFNTLLKEKDAGLAVVTSREILGRERSRRPMRTRKARVQRKEVDPTYFHGMSD
jgi:transcription-repair coupling factor (superfamily II helicase)